MARKKACSWSMLAPRRPYGRPSAYDDKGPARMALIVQFRDKCLARGVLAGCRHPVTQQQERFAFASGSTVCQRAPTWQAVERALACEGWSAAPRTLESLLRAQNI